MRQARAVVTAVAAGLFVLGAGSGPVSADSVRPVKQNPLSFRLAATSPAQGFEAMSNGDSGTIYVASRSALSGGAIASAEAVNARRGADLELSLTAEGVRRMGAVTRKSGADRLAIFANGKLIAVGGMDFDAAGSRLVVSGLSADKAAQVTRLLSVDGFAAGRPVMTLVPSQSRVQPGRAVTVDVFIRRVADLRTYQVSIDVTGGQRGELVVEDLQMDSARPNYVFGALQKIDAVDKGGHRFGSVLFNGGVDATAQSYLGSVTLRPSDDAAGTFTVTARSGVRTTLVWSSQNQPVDFAIAPAVITVGKRSSVMPTDR